MLPVAVLLLIAALGRVMASERWPQLDPLRKPWRRLVSRVTAYVRAAPGTYVYLFVLLITTWVLQTSSSTVARQLLLERSTNLHRLARDPVRVIFASAFWVSSVWELLTWAVLFTLAVATVERSIGTARTATVFVAGHVGATLLTAGGLWAALQADLVESSIVHVKDVGASYGFLAVAAVLTYRLPRRWPPLYAAVLTTALTAALAVHPSFTDFGHLLALGIGFACYPLARTVAVSRRPHEPATRSTTARSR